MKRIIVLFISFLLVISIPSLAQAASFKDVSPTYQFSKEINYLVEKGIISGYPDGTFKPNQAVTRAQAAIMIGRALSLNGTERNTKFKDVDAKVTGSGYIASATDNEIIGGYSDGTFRPTEPVTRGQLAIILSRAFNLKETAAISFKDVSPKTSAYPYIGKLIYAEITKGYPNNTYQPNNAVTRGQFSAFMERALKYNSAPKSVNVTITGKDLAKEFVSIKNNGATSVYMTGWKLVSIVGPQTYTFPDQYILEAGKTIYITSGPNAQDKPPIYLKWTNSNIWLNSGDAAELYDASGKKVSSMK